MAVTNFAPNIVNNINLNFYFQPTGNPHSNLFAKDEQGGMGGGYQRKSGGVVNQNYVGGRFGYPPH